MKNIKKLAVILLAVVMCISAMSITSFATEATFSTEAQVSARFTNDGSQLIATVTTSEAAGAIQATLTYSNKLTYASGEFIEKDVTATDVINHDSTNKTITFVVATDDFQDGNRYWANFTFNVNKENAEDVKLKLSKVSACDVSETLATGITLKDVEFTMSANAIQTLGTQYREVIGTRKAGLRFGTRLERNEENSTVEIEVEGETDPVAVKAVACGYLWNWESNLNGADLEATATVEDGEVKVDSGSNKVHISKTVMAKDETSMVFGVAFVGFSDANKANSITAKPFVVYKDGSEYKLLYGDKLTKSYADVESYTELLEKNNSVA